MWNTIESTVSVFFAFVVGFVVAVLGGNLVYLAWDDPQVRWLLPFWLIVLSGEGAFLLWLKWDLERGDLLPFIPRFAMRQIRWPIVLRPFVATWWLIHFCVAIAALLLIEHRISGTTDLSTGDVPAVVMVALIAWILSHCSLLYLLLAVTAVHRSETAVNALWRGRLLVDLIVVLMAFSVSRLWV